MPDQNLTDMIFEGPDGDPNPTPEAQMPAGQALQKAMPKQQAMIEANKKYVEWLKANPPQAQTMVTDGDDEDDDDYANTPKGQLDKATHDWEDAVYDAVDKNHFWQHDKLSNDPLLNEALNSTYWKEEAIS